MKGLNTAVLIAVNILYFVLAHSWGKTTSFGVYGFWFSVFFTIVLAVVIMYLVSKFFTLRSKPKKISNMVLQVLIGLILIAIVALGIYGLFSEFSAETSTVSGGDTRFLYDLVSASVSSLLLLILLFIDSWYYEKHLKPKNDIQGH